MQIAFLVLLFILGACFGSFLCCQARRLHLKANSRKSLGPRSVCMSCKKTLKWYDNIPIISWLILKGKCHHCHKKIGCAEIISELSLAVAFVIIALGTGIQFLSASPAEYVTFIALLVFTMTLAFLAIYDGLYGELPTMWLIIAIAYSLAFATYIIFQSPIHLGEQILNIFLSVLVLGGLYLILFLVSKGKWVGDGDWLLAVAIAVVLGSPWLALITLFLTNLLALLAALPKLKKTHKIHLGPYMVAAFVITISFSGFFNSLINMI